MRTFCCAIALMVVGLTSLPGLAADEQAELAFIRYVAPMLHDKCLPCHGADEQKIKSGLDLRTRAGVLKGGDSKKSAVVLGQPEQSPLYLAVTRAHESWEPMPPKEADQLTAEQVGWVKEWILGGAAWPDEARVKELAKARADKWSGEDGVAVKTSGGLSPEWTNRKYKPESLWAYQPVKKPAVPASGADIQNLSSGIQHPIDAFLAARRPAGLPLAPAADRATLIRRATFDLTGLPPKPEEIKSFLDDPLPDSQSFSKVVERLLASPHYGERMAQHWLDVVRYADSSGFANDFERGNAWRYRDYVVRAFNADKPYDQFVREQIAGDELRPDAPEMLVAVGFLRMGPWELTSMEVPKVARQRFLDDVANSVGESFLAHPLQCARCHDHKFDPVPTHDYYSLQAVFATAQLAEREAAFLPAENVSGFKERKYLEMRRAEYLATLKRLDEKALRAAEAWFLETGIASDKWNAAVARARQQEGGRKNREFTGLFSTARAALMKQGVPEDQFPPKLQGFTPEEIGNQRIATKGLERLKWELDRYQPFALSVYNGLTPQVTAVLSPVRMPASRLTEGELEQSCILAGGSPFSPGEKVKPGVLSVLGEVRKAPIPDAIEGRRRAFAEWVASPENPLTTRTIVNRVWLWHFGQAIAGNPNNFGVAGKRPTHPELLDWLAATFVEGSVGGSPAGSSAAPNPWSIKAMHRLIMSSEAYARSTRHPDPKLLAEKDPNGASYVAFKPRRLSAEELRDAMLAATGELNLAIGGIPNRPEINLEAALQPRQVMGTFAAAWTPNPKPEQRHRRSLYALKIRGLRDPFREVFNEPAPDFSCENREASTVTPQVFSLFNSQASHARALALAHRAVGEGGTGEAALRRCFQLAYGRQPDADELSMCLAHWRAMEERQKSLTCEAPKLPLEVRRDAVEENTGERFTFSERLEAYADFVPDLQPTAVDARTRALADVCLVLFNSNAFAYVY